MGGRITSTRPRAASLLQALPPALSPGAPIEVAVAELTELCDEHCLVGTQRRPRGALSAAELAAAVRYGLGAMAIEELLVADLQRVSFGAGLEQARRQLERSAAPLLIVTDGHGEPIGCIPRRSLEGALPTARADRSSHLLERLPESSVRILRAIGGAAPRGAWLVGGVVRDLLLRRPSGDLDVAISGSIAPLLATMGGAVRAHERFGTGTIVREDSSIDVAETRRESYAKPAALPDVEPAGLAEDLFRRDFTVNALAVALHGEDWNRLIDPYGGREDLARRTIRVLHGLSFMDDPTRAFRAVRLAARLGFTIERRTARAMRSAIERGCIELLTPARLLRELRLTFGEEALARAVGLLDRYELLTRAGLAGEPPVGSLRRLPSVSKRYRRLGGPEIEPWIVALGLLLPQPADAALARLNPSRHDRDSLLEIARHARALARRLSRARTPAAIWDACRDLRPSTWVAALVCNSDPRVRRAIDLQVTVLSKLRLAIDGHDLSRAGVTPGPAIRTGLEAAQRALIEGRAGDARSQLRVALRAVARS